MSENVYALLVIADVRDHFTQTEKSFGSSIAIVITQAHTITAANKPTHPRFRLNAHTHTQTHVNGIATNTNYKFLSFFL